MTSSKNTLSSNLTIPFESLILVFVFNLTFGNGLASRMINDRNMGVVIGLESVKGLHANQMRQSD